MRTLICVLLIATCFSVVQLQDDNLDEILLGRFHRQRLRQGQQCTVRNRPGICKRRSRCKFPSNGICRTGLNPVICCFDDMEHFEEPKTTQMSVWITRAPIQTTQKPIRITHKPVRTTRTPIRTTTKHFTTLKPAPLPIKDESTDIDIVFPGCGNRQPKDPEPENTGRRRGGLLGRRQKRLAQNPNLLSRLNRAAIKPVIVGGHASRPHSWPWMVAIFKKTGPNLSSSRFLCGASLISKKYVLSAAHCFTKTENNEPSKFFVKVGAHNTDRGKPYEIASIKSHPKYKERFHYNDLSLLKIKEEVALGSKVYPVCLPSPSLRSRIGNTKKNVTVTGWGDTSFGGPNTKLLQEVDLPIVPVKQCNESYHKIAANIFPQGVNQLFMCAGFKDGGKDSCQGDSGGPLMMQMDGGRYVQLGVVSFGLACAQPGFPGVYTRVSQFTKWIQENTDLG